MSYGLLGMNQQMENQALQGMSRVSELERSRDRANKNIKAAGHQRDRNSAGMGAGLGMSIGGPAGAVVGGVGGYLVSRIFG